MRIELTDKELDYIFQLLAQRPLGEALALYEKLRAQAMNPPVEELPEAAE